MAWSRQTPSPPETTPTYAYVPSGEISTTEPRVEIGTFPLHAKVVCSAQVLSVNGNPPATLSSLDVFPAN